MEDWTMHKNSKKWFAIGIALIAFSTTATAVALDCIDARSERVTYELATLTIDGEVVDSDEFGEELSVSGSYDEGVHAYVSFDELTGAGISFAPSTGGTNE
jgi:hypothetical protein